MNFPEALEAARLPREFSQHFGDYELIEEIARGGMGVVFKARQISLGRIVAVKVIRSEWLAGSDELRRFLVESSAAARLEHPNIVTIHEVGQVAGQHFYSMKLVEGRSLGDLAREQPLPPRKAAQYVQKIALAIHYAHSRKVLHRDLKPANVLIDQHDEPQVTDFGLAKIMQSEAGVTMSGTIMGSPSYMPPEQARGEIAAVGVESDVYGLGAVLYELLCGRPPFRAETMVETLRQVQEQDPVSPRLLNHKLPRDLETICLKCLEKARERRYPTALELAADLTRFQQDEPIRARPVGLIARAGRWCMRRPALAGVSATALMLLLVVAIGSPIVAFRLNRARLLAQERELNARRSAYGADMGLVQQAIDQRRFSFAEQLLASHRPAAGQIDLRGWEWRYLWQLLRGPPATPLARHRGEVNGINVSPDGRWIGSLDKTGMLKLWSVRENKVVLEIEGCGGPPPALSDELMAAFDRQGLIRFWSLATGEEIGPPIPQAGGLSSIQFHPRGDSLIAFGGAHLKKYDAFSRELMSDDPVPVGPVTALSRDGSTLAVSSGQRQITIWRAGTGEFREIRSDHVFTEHPLALALSGDGRTLAAAVALEMGTNYRVQIFDLDKEVQTTNFPAHMDQVTSAAFSADDSHLVTRGYDEMVEVREKGTWRTVSMLRSGDAPATLTLLAQSGLILNGGRDGQVQARPWQTDLPRRGPLPLDLASLIVAETRGGVAPDGSALAALDPEGNGVLIDSRAGRVRKDLALPLTDVTKVAVGPAGRLLAIDSAAGVGLWETEGSICVAHLKRSGTRPWSELVFSPDERWLAGVKRQGQAVQLWSLAPPYGSTVRNGWPTNAVTVQFSPDSTRIAFGHQSGKISVWDIASGRLFVELIGHTKPINRVAFSSDGQRLGSTSHDKTARVWDLATRREVAMFGGSRTSFFHVSFSPDGRRLFVNEWNDALLFDLEAKRQVARLQSFTPFFLDDDTVLGLNQRELWHWQPPTLKAIDAMSTPLTPAP